LVDVEETGDRCKAENFGIEISDMFLVKFIVMKQMYKLFYNTGNQVIKITELFQFILKKKRLLQK